MELSDADAARAILIRDLRSDFGVNDEGVEIVLQLVDQVHGLRRALVSLRMEIQATRDK
jgi:chaperone modulatory protein CbpM